MRLSTRRTASSALSASSIRQQFSTPLNIHLSRYGIGFLRRAGELLGVELGLREPGYLFLASAAGEAVLRANHAIQRGEACAVELLEPSALAGRFPWISTDGVTLAPCALRMTLTRSPSNTAAAELVVPRSMPR